MYATLQDLEKRIAPQALVELADDNKDGLADTDVIDAALEDASAQIDLFLAARHAVPLASPPALFARLAADLAIHALFARRRSALSPEFASRYAAAVSMLESISAGRLSLPGLASNDLPESTNRNEDKTFSAESLEGF